MLELYLFQTAIVVFILLISGIVMTVVEFKEHVYPSKDRKKRAAARRKKASKPTTRTRARTRAKPRTSRRA